MKNLIKKQKSCPYCRKISLSMFNIGSKPSRCSNCNGLVKNPYWLDKLFLLPIFLFYVLSPPGLYHNTYGENIFIVVIIFVLIVPMLLHILLVPIVAVQEKEGDVSKEKKD